jgi:hypothetical protein
MVKRIDGGERLGGRWIKHIQIGLTIQAAKQGVGTIYRQLRWQDER